MNSFKIGLRTIGPDAPPFIIAEMSGNHNQSLDRALEIVEAAAKAGAHALKLQTYTADTMTLDIGRGRVFHQRPQQPVGRDLAVRPVRTGPHAVGVACADFRPGQRTGHARRSRTPFDETAVDFLESLDVPAYKIASFREHRPPADPQSGGHRQTDDHLHRHGQHRRAG